MAGGDMDGADTAVEDRRRQPAERGPMGGHHLILGSLEDFLTGKTLEDTLDERYRQKIARLLVTEKGYRHSEIESRSDLLVQADHRRAVIRVDFVVRLAGRAVMVVRFGPGSLVSRERPLLAISRLIEAYQVPVAVVTNGEDAEILDAASGRVTGRGLTAIPPRAALAAAARVYAFARIPPERAAMESRIAYCYEVDGACPCDETVCRIS